MAVTKARVGKGTILSEKSTGSHVNIAEMVKLVPPKLDTGKAEATHLTSPDYYKEWIPQGFIDAGEINFEANYYTSEATRMKTLLETQAATEWKFTVPDLITPSTGTNTICTLQGFLQSWQPIDEASADQSKPMRAMGTIVITGKPALVAAT